MKNNAFALLCIFFLSLVFLQIPAGADDEASSQNIFHPLYLGMTLGEVQRVAEVLSSDESNEICLNVYGDYCDCVSVQIADSVEIKVLFCDTGLDNANDTLAEVSSILTYDGKFVTPDGLRPGMPVFDAVEIMEDFQPVLRSNDERIIGKNGIHVQFGWNWLHSPRLLWTSDVVWSVQLWASTSYWNKKYALDKEILIKETFTEWLGRLGSGDRAAKIFPPLHIGMARSVVAQFVELGDSTDGLIYNGGHALFYDCRLPSGLSVKIAFGPPQSPGFWYINPSDDLLLYLIETNDTTFRTPSGIRVGMPIETAESLLVSSQRWDNFSINDSSFTYTYDSTGLSIFERDSSGLVNSILERPCYMWNYANRPYPRLDFNWK